MTAVVTASCLIRDADVDEASFTDLLVRQAGLDVEPDRVAPSVRVATRDGQVVGFASVTLTGCDPRLDYVYVHHQARRAGVGRALVDDASRLDPAGRRLRIEAHPAAETFFTRLGACREGTVQPDPRTPFCRALFSVR